MDEIIPGLWVGDFPSAMNVGNLKAHGIYSILSAMRGRVSIHETFIRHQIQLDDTEDADILMHFLPSIQFIQAELAKGRGVLVHCQAGISRSSTIVAAYLMYSKQLDPETALELLRKARPSIEPNQGFLQQLEVFHKSRYKITRREKAIRMFYMDRAVDEVMNGDGSLPDNDMYAKYPRTPSDSLPGTPCLPRRRIRCKMCRQELATREHMLDHGQLGAATPAFATPAGSRRPSTTIPLNQGNTTGSILSSTSRTSIGEKNVQNVPVIPERHPLQSFRRMSQSLQDSSESRSALDIEDETEFESNVGTTSQNIPIDALQSLGQQLSDAVISTAPGFKTQIDQAKKPLAGGNPDSGTSATSDHPTTHFNAPSDIAAQLFANPKLAALRPAATSSVLSPTSILKPVGSAPILANPKCSGYFVEPMKWMDHFLSEGQLAGKMTCPNKKCGAKLGNFDWAGVRCGCNEWVTPGFCINRSKVDEVV
ncbi:hypothetical protein B0H34DRAFT_659598 [Crassisporium funariophilum]|nr:hypothetical protein B0H34DRAFT_659598 [Crassisporium funariophilum]